MTTHREHADRIGHELGIAPALVSKVLRAHGRHVIADIASGGRVNVTGLGTFTLSPTGSIRPHFTPSEALLRDLQAAAEAPKKSPAKKKPTTKRATRRT